MIDRILVDYLRSGLAWVFVGSGPSTEIGYPTWRQLAEVAIAAVKTDRPGTSYANLETPLRLLDFPEVFEEAARRLGTSRLLQVLHSDFAPSRSGTFTSYLLDGLCVSI